MLTKKNRVGITTVIGSTLGAGLFGVPYVFAHAGVLQGTIRTVVIGGILIILNLLQAEVSLSMPPHLRLAGQIQKIFPKRLGLFGVFITSMQFFIAIFAYTSLVGAFVNTLLGPHFLIDPAISATIYSLIVGWVLYRGNLGVQKYDKKIVVIFVCLLTFLIFYGFSIATPGHFLIADKAERFLPYGVLIYALNNVTVIPVLEETLGREKRDMPYIIIIGGIICITLVLLWGRSIVGISGMATSQDALSGLQHFLPLRIVKLSGLVGILAIISPHLLIGEHFIDTLKQSFRFHTLDARMTVVLLPLIAYLYLQSDFVGTIGFSGAIFTGLLCVTVGAMNLILHKKHGKKETYILPYNTFFSYLIIGVFSLGIIYECVKQFLL